MAFPLDRKQCECSPDCTFTLRAGSSWRYYRGHSPAGKLKKHTPTRRQNNPKGTSFLDTSITQYQATIAQAKRELALLTSEIDRLEEQAVATEKTARAARDAAGDLTERHLLLSNTIAALMQLTGQLPTEEEWHSARGAHYPTAEEVIHG
jgi:small-conductance mechanosensitive channel